MRKACFVRLVAPRRLPSAVCGISGLLLLCLAVQLYKQACRPAVGSWQPQQSHVQVVSGATDSEQSNAWALART